MTILNYVNDGRHPELIVLFRAVSHLKSETKDNILALCTPPNQNNPDRLRGALTRWTELGLFTVDGETIRLNHEIIGNQPLPDVCRALMLKSDKCQPLWGENNGTTADFVRGVAWALAQNIYTLPTTWKEVDPVQGAQVTQEFRIVENDVRWGGLRHWMCYLGFASYVGDKFLVDPTNAIKSVLPSIFGNFDNLFAQDFITGLANRLPVLDFGNYRIKVEEVLNRERWRRPDDGHLSMSLSLALRRLEQENIIQLLTQADGNQTYRITGRNYRIWKEFNSVHWMGAHA